MTQEIDFNSIHKQAAELCESNMILAYAVAKEMRKRVVGRDSEQVKQELLASVAYGAWNDLLRIQQRGLDRPESIKPLLELFSEALIFVHDILTDKITYAKVPDRPRK